MMAQHREYFEMYIKSLDEIMRWFEEAKPKDRTITKLYAVSAEDKLVYLHRNNVDIDYKNYREKIKPYL